jgi:hypothetical protein
LYKYFHNIVFINKFDSKSSLSRLFKYSGVQSSDPLTGQSSDPLTVQSSDPLTGQSSDPLTVQSSDPLTGQSSDPLTGQSSDFSTTYKYITYLKYSL